VQLDREALRNPAQPICCNVMAHLKKTLTMRVILYLIIFSLLISCQSWQEKKHNDFVFKIETIGLDKFKNIGFGTRGDYETYNYCLPNDSSISWIYNRKTKQFEFPLVRQDLQKLPKDYKAYIIDLRDKIKSLNVIMITQSPWCGNIVRFWISDKEIIAFVDPEFKFDDRFKNEWLTELKSGQKIRDDWYYIKIKK
jgi:hypothetical protein